MKSPNEIQKENLENPQVDEPVVEVDQKLIETAHGHEDYYKGKIAEILGEDAKNASKYDMELNTLLQYASEKGAESMEDVLWEIRYLANHLGTPGYGENRIKFMYRYVYLLRETMESERKLKMMEGFNA